MSSPTGTSDPDAPAAVGRQRSGSVRIALTLSLLLALLLGAYAFHTTDSFGIERVRSASHIWRTVPSALARSGGAAIVPIYTAALVGTVAGFFVLLWLAVAVRQERQPERGSRIAPARAWLSAILTGGAADRRGAVLTGVVTALLILFAAWRMGAFAPARVLGIPDTFASVDHPFHVGRAEALLRSVLDGESLRWVASHQGGYPAEFYPFGFAWLEVGLWALALGQAALPIVHKFAVIALFVAPAFVYRAMARRDGWPPIVGLSAFVLHVAVPGGMWSGGYMELVHMGLVANVSAAFAVLVAMVAAADAFASGRRRPVAFSAIAAGAAIWCNPRSAVGLAVCLASAWAVAAVRSRRDVGRITMQLGVIAVIAGLLAAPELASLLRFRTLYYFIRMTSYGSPLDYLGASMDAVSLPGFALAVAGLAAAVAAPASRYMTKTTAAALVAYALATVVLAFGASALVQQLEATRLMPLQRYLTIYLAAVGLHAVASAAAARAPGRAGLPIVLQAAVIAAVLFVFLGPARLLPFWSRGLFPVHRSTVPAMATFQQVLAIADRTAPAGTAILVMGSAVSDHQQLWAPVRLDRLFFYGSWMWYWHQDHRGPYDPRSKAKYDTKRIEEVFEREYLDRHAIGAVVLTPAYQAAADGSPNLQRVFGGDYGLYAVTNPVPAITLGPRRPDSLTIANHRMAAHGTSDGGEAIVRRNWFPRWRALVNGQPVPISRSDDGYMRVPVPAGTVSLELNYALDPADIAARGAAILGVLFTFAILVRKGEGGRVKGEE